MTPPERETTQLEAHYDRALEEYRFQVNLNWRRSEYFFVLNVGILIGGASLFDSTDPILAAALFSVGAILAILSVVANRVQHGYYRSARDLKQTLEQRLALEELALATTPGMRSGIERLGRVRTFLAIMLVAIALADLVGATLTLVDVL